MKKTLALIMIGIITLVPILKLLLEPVISPIYEFFGASPAMFAGTILFALSDLVLSFVFFKEGENKSRNVILNHTLYYTSQYILVLSILT